MDMNKRAVSRAAGRGETRRRAGHELVGERRDRGDPARARRAVHRARARGELPGPARQPRQLPRQRAPADARLPARGAHGGDRTRLLPGARADDGRRSACERRPDARRDVDLQRLVRPRAGARARRDRPGGRDEAPALDRLDPHRARPGRAGARLHQVGRPALVRRRGAGIAAARRAAREHRAVRTGLRLPRRRAAGIASRCAAAAPGRRALHAAAAGAAGRGDGAARRAAPRRGEASGHSRGPRRPERSRMAIPDRARRKARCTRADEPESGGCIPDRSPAARRGAVDVPEPRRRAKCSARPTSSSASTGSTSAGR